MKQMLIVAVWLLGLPVLGAGCKCDSEPQPSKSIRGDFVGLEDENEEDEEREAEEEAEEKPRSPAEEPEDEEEADEDENPEDEQ